MFKCISIINNCGIQFAMLTTLFLYTHVNFNFNLLKVKLLKYIFFIMSAINCVQKKNIFRHNDQHVFEYNGGTPKRTSIKMMTKTTRIGQEIHFFYTDHCHSSMIKLMIQCSIHGYRLYRRPVFHCIVWTSTIPKSNLYKKRNKCVIYARIYRLDTYVRRNKKGGTKIIILCEVQRIFIFSVRIHCASL